MFEGFKYRKVRMSNGAAFTLNITDIRRLKQDQVEYGRTFIMEHKWPCRGYYYRVHPERVMILVGVHSTDAVDAAKKGGNLVDVNIQ